MRFIDPSYEIIPQEEGLLGVYKQIEKAARTAYKSEDKIAEGSAQKMVESLCKLNHGAALEHGTIYLAIPDRADTASVYDKYCYNQYSRVVQIYDVASEGYGTVYVTTNARVIFENKWQDDLVYICEPTEFHEKRITVKFITSIGVVREILRHRKFSFLNESTRYCNYSKDKFGSELTFIIPQWIYKMQEEESSSVDYLTGEVKDWIMNLSGEILVNQLSCEDRHIAAWVDCLERCEQDYIYLTRDEEGYQLKAEEARGILPLDLKSELIVTGFISDWIHFFRLRSYVAATGKPHPDIQKLADGLLYEFTKEGYCTLDEVKNEQIEECN